MRLLGPAPEAHNWRLLAAPTAAGLLVAVLVIHVFPKARGSGVNQTKAALYIYDGYIPFRTAVGNSLPRRWPSAPAIPWARKIHPCRSAPAWPPL